MIKASEAIEMSTKLHQMFKTESLPHILNSLENRIKGTAGHGQREFSLNIYALEDQSGHLPSPEERKIIADELRSNGYSYCEWDMGKARWFKVSW